jgi:hypothetical protein
VVVVSGEKARQTFFSAKAFDLTEGFRILSGAVHYFFAGVLVNLIHIPLKMPMLRGVTSDLQTRRISLIHKRLGAVQRNVPLSNCTPYSLLIFDVPEDSSICLVIPSFLEDYRRSMETLGTSGTFDPFEKVYNVGFIAFL